jgi:hypothetical protein
VAVEDIGSLWNTKQPGYDDTADIQAALKAFLYGSYTYNPTNTDPDALPNPSLARHLQLLSNRVTAQETLGTGSDYLPLAQIGALTGVADGYIAMASDSNGGAVESLYASAFYTNEAPTTDLVDGILWVDKDSAALDTYVYDSTLLPGDPWVRINDLKNIIAAKGDLLVGTAAEGLDNLTVGANGTVLTADDTQALGVKWQAPSVYSQPTLGTTAIASGATVTNINDLTINSTTIPTSKTLVATDSTAYVIPSMSGNSGKYLTNDGSTPSWVTAPSSGGMTLLSSGSLTGSSISIDSISGSYQDLKLIIRNFRPATDGAALNGRINNDTSNIYGNRTAVAESDNSFSNTSWNNLSYNQDNGSSTSLIRLTFIDYANTTTLKVAELYSVTNNETTPTNINYTTGIAIARTTSAISSIQLFPSSGNFTSGNYYLYGVK